MNVVPSHRDEVFDDESDDSFSCFSEHLNGQLSSLPIVTAHSNDNEVTIASLSESIKPQIEL